MPRHGASPCSRPRPMPRPAAPPTATPPASKAIFLSLDIDVVDPGNAPAAAPPSRAGLNLRPGGHEPPARSLWQVPELVEAAAS